METSGALPSLVSSARDGDQDAWDAIVERYLPLVSAPIRARGLSEADGDGVSGTVWLRLVEHLVELIEPADLSDWLSATANDECVRLAASRSRLTPVDPPYPDAPEGPTDSAAEDRRREAARAAFTWRSVDAEPMKLLRDSALETDAVVRGAGDPGRLLVFGLGDLTLEIEVGAGAVAGRMSPPQDATVMMQTPGAHDRTVAADAEGSFRIEEVGSGPVRFVATTSSAVLSTVWVTL